jgi:quercetin dioxygenase-like cupin family protein
MLETLALATLLVGTVAQAEGDTSFTLDTADVEQQAVEGIPGLPPGLLAGALHENPRTGMSSSILTYPEGYREPRHYHESCGHYMYILKGRIESPDGVLTPGMFAYAAPGERHGPFKVLEPSEALFYTDGPFDFIVDDVE